MYEPSHTDMIRELQQTLGLFDGARSESPETVWYETLREVQALMRDAGRPCIFGKRCHCRPDLPTYHETAAAP